MTDSPLLPEKPDPDASLSSYGRALLKRLGGRASDLKLSDKELKSWAYDQPDSILNVVPVEFAEEILAIPPELFTKTEEELERDIQGVTRQDRRIKINFWAEREKAASEIRNMSLERVTIGTGVGSWALYHPRLLENPALFAWLMHPPAEYLLQIKEGVNLGLSRLMEIMQLPLQYEDQRGVSRVNGTAGMLILHAFKLLDSRLYGAPTQKNLNVNVDTQAPERSFVNMEDLEKKLRELEQSFETKSVSLPEPTKKAEIEVDSREIDS